MDLSQLSKEFLKLKSELEELKSQLHVSQVDANLLRNRVEALESFHKHSLMPDENLGEIDTDAAKANFWSISPKQHAILQLIFLEYTNVSIAERLNVSEGAAKSYVRNLCESLCVSSRIQARDVYLPVFNGVDSAEYQEQAEISKDWAVQYAGLSFDEAKKLDPYFSIICIKRYRKQKRVINQVQSPFKPA